MLAAAGILLMQSFETKDTPVSWMEIVTGSHSKETGSCSRSRAGGHVSLGHYPEVGSVHMRSKCSKNSHRIISLWKGRPLKKGQISHASHEAEELQAFAAV